MQTSYQTNMNAAVPGLVADLAPKYVRSMVNASANRDTWTCTVSTAAAGTYTLTVNGQAVSFVATGSPSAAQVAAGLVAAINAAVPLNQEVYAAPTTGGAFTVTALEAGVPVTVSGQDANQSAPSHTVTPATATNIPFGVAVALLEASNSSEQCKLPSSTGDSLLGIALFDHAAFNLSNANAVQPGTTQLSSSVGYLLTQTVNVMRKGTVWVQVEASVTAETAVYARVTANGSLTQLGALRGDNDSGNAIALPNAKFLTSAAAGGLAIVALNN